MGLANNRDIRKYATNYRWKAKANTKKILAPF